MEISEQEKLGKSIQALVRDNPGMKASEAADIVYKNKDAGILVNGELVGFGYNGMLSALPQMLNGYRH
jgi:hypothetical protein